MVTCSPPGSSTAPRWAPEARTSSDTRAALAWRSKVSTPAVLAYGFTTSTSASSLASRLGMTKLAVPNE